jgi:hypothetical protein
MADLSGGRHDRRGIFGIVIVIISGAIGRVRTLLARNEASATVLLRPHKFRVRDLFFLVPAAGLEPALPYEKGILSPLFDVAACCLGLRPVYESPVLQRFLLCVPAAWCLVFAGKWMLAGCWSGPRLREWE